MTDHLVARGASLAWAPPAGPLAGSPGLEGWSVLDASTAAVHTGFGLSRLAPGGSVPAHVHSYEESLYVLDGRVVVQTPGEAARLGPGDYGLIPVGVPHSLRNDGTDGDPVRAAVRAVAAAGARPGHPAGARAGGDRRRSRPTCATRGPVATATSRRRTWIRRLQTQDRLAVSASMRSALLVYSGISVKMMVDSDLGAVLSTMFMVQYEPDGLAGAHDHPFEEAYLILEGAVEATFDDASYVLEPGDVAWAGVGCLHGFRNVGDGPVRWLETQAPQPPPRHSYRFARDWDYLRQRLDGGDD